MELLNDSSVKKLKIRVTSNGTIQLWCYTEYTDANNNRGYVASLIDGKPVTLKGFANSRKG